MSFEEFRKTFIPKLSKKSTQLNKAFWLLETTGSPDAADLKADLDTELKILLSNKEIYQNLLQWEKEPHDEKTKRELNVLIRAFKQNQVPEDLLEKMSQKEAEIGMLYANFRPTIDGKKLSENDVREILKLENDPEMRKKAWNASKEIGKVLAPEILKLVELRNKAAKLLGYPDYFQMQLELQEVDKEWLLKTLNSLAAKSDAAYTKMLKEIEKNLRKRFGVSELGPWSWSEPFSQEDPLDAKELDELLKDVDIVQTTSQYYQKMGIDVSSIMSRSDFYEREGKNQHAFCMHVDREGDVRTLNNVKPSIKWLETVLHELGHGIYELGLNKELPWLLKEPPHMITTEAMALIAGRQAYLPEALIELVGEKDSSLMEKAEKSLKRRQLIFSRWVMVMTAFESELYRDPAQDLGALWWDFVEKYQKIQRPKARDVSYDWATKYHIGLAPVYYFSYLLGEMFASQIQISLEKQTHQKNLMHPGVAQVLNQKLFYPGNSMPWDQLIKHVTGEELSEDAWVKEFAT